MPTYEYHCTKCGYVHEELQKITAEPLKTCPKCHVDALRRGPGGGIGLAFTGTGFYSTDYPKSSSHSPSKPKSTEDSNPKPKAGGCGCGKNACDA